METEIGCVFGAQCAFETLINRIQLNVTTKISQANGCDCDCDCVRERRGRMMTMTMMIQSVQAHISLECIHLVFLLRNELKKIKEIIVCQRNEKPKFTYAPMYAWCTLTLLAQY